MENNFKFEVNLIESEAGWGSKIDEVKKFDTYQEAVEYITKFNSSNTASSAPDWYMYAEPRNFTITK
jgi:hypothetical protein